MLNKKKENKKQISRLGSTSSGYHTYSKSLQVIELSSQEKKAKKNLKLNADKDHKYCFDI